MWPLPPVCEDPGSSISTPMAKSRNSFDPIGKWNALQKFSKRHAIAVAVKSHQKEALSHLIHNAPNKRNQPSEKMRFIHDDHIKFADLTILHLVQCRNANAGCSPIIVCDDIVFVTVPDIARMLDNENATTDADVPRDDAENARGLARKHRANDEIKRHLRETRASYLNERYRPRDFCRCWNCTVWHLGSRNGLETVKNSCIHEGIPFGHRFVQDGVSEHRPDCCAP